MTLYKDERFNKGEHWGFQKLDTFTNIFELLIHVSYQNLIKIVTSYAQSNISSTGSSNNSSTISNSNIVTWDRILLVYLSSFQIFRN